jgi:hypothetical protein
LENDGRRDAATIGYPEEDALGVSLLETDGVYVDDGGLNVVVIVGDNEEKLDGMFVGFWNGGIVGTKYVIVGATTGDNVGTDVGTLDDDFVGTSAGMSVGVLKGFSLGVLGDIENFGFKSVGINDEIPNGVFTRIRDGETEGELDRTGSIDIGDETGIDVGS